MQIPKRNTRSEFFVPQGGINQVTPPLLLPDGAAIDMLNFEPDVNEGYTRIAGLDRWNGYETPSDLTVQIATLAPISNEVSKVFYPSDKLIGSQSGAIMTFRQDFPTPRQFPYGGFAVNGSAFSIYVSDVRGSFLSGELLSLESNSAVFYRMMQAPLRGSGNSAQELAKSRADYRAACRVSFVRPGAARTFGVAGQSFGPVLGVAHYQGKTLVFKEDANRNGKVVANRPFVDGDPEGLRSGQWLGQELLDVDSLGAKFKFVEHNFFGGTQTQFLYGVSGTSQAFFFDGTTYTHIATGIPGSDDKPSLIAAHVNRLALVVGSTVMLSAADDPTDYDFNAGAGLVACGDTVTGILSVKGSDQSDALLIATKTRILILYGDSNANYSLRPLQNETGGVDDSLQMIGQPVFMSDYGVSTLAATDTYGGFNMSSISEQVKPFLTSRRRKVVASLVARNKNQYRLFFDDGYALYITMDGVKVKGIGIIYLSKLITCAWSTVLDNGEELMLLGDAEGDVFRLDVGPSLDGEAMPFYVRMAFNHKKSPRVIKRYRRGVMELTSSGYSEMEVGYDLNYANDRQDVTPDQEAGTPIYGSGGAFDEAVWDEAYFDSGYQVPFVIDM